MLDIVLDTLLDTLKLIPFLFVAFLIIELVEHKLKNKKLIEKSGKFSPIIGAILGAIPQCGFGTLATNLYVTRILSLGTLIAIYLSTSDEMLPVMLSENVDFSIILKIIAFKVLIGMVCGVIIDLLYHPKNKENYEMCEKEHCHCEHGIILSTLKHTLSISLYILIINFILNIVFFYQEEQILSHVLLQNTYFGSFITSLLGLIPNCASSVIITELYLNGAIKLGSMIGGLLTGSGVALVVLFKSNKNMKENLAILALVYFIGAFIGTIIDILL